MSDHTIKAQIMSAISKTDNTEMKLVMLLMLQVVDEIGGKIDNVLADEKQMREAVLNGHAPVHHAHHEWIGEKIKKEADQEQSDIDSKRSIRDDIISKLVWAVLAAAFTWALTH